MTEQELTAESIQNIQNYVKQNIGNPDAIMGGMIQYGLSADQLNQALGYNRNDIDAYFRNAGLLDENRNYYIGELDPTIKSLINPALGTDFYGNYAGQGIDPSKFQVGLGNYQTQDIGQGKYNILGADNSVLGTGYKSPEQAYQELAFANAQKGSVNAGDKWENPLLQENQQYYIDLYTGLPVDLSTLQSSQYYGDTGFIDQYFRTSESGEQLPVYVQPRERQVNRSFSSQEELDTALKDYVAGRSKFGQDTQHSMWEALGQALEGKPGVDAREWGGLPYDDSSETISGENTLYGSTPIFYDGKLLGYNFDLAAAPGQTGSKSWSGGQGRAEWDPLSYQAKYNGKSHAWATGLGRQIDPAAYKGLVQRTGETQVFSPLANVSKLPGWTNVEGYQHADKNYGGWGAGLVDLANKLGPIGDIGGDMGLKGMAENLERGGLLFATNKLLATADPLGEGIAKGVADVFGVEGGSLGLVRTVGEPIGNLIGAVFAGGLPIGSLIMGLDAASQGNSEGVTNALKNAGAAYAGSVAGGAASGAVGGGTAGAVAGGATGAGVSTAIRGGGLEDVGKAMLAGGLTGGITSAGAPYIQDFLKTNFGLSYQVSQQASKAITKGLSDAIGGLAGGATLDEALVRGLISGGSAYANTQLKSAINQSLNDAGVADVVSPRIVDAMTSAAAQYLASQVTGGNIDTRKLAAGMLAQVLQPIAAKKG